MQQNSHDRPAVRRSSVSLGALIFALPALAAAADAPSISIGAGMRTDFTHTDTSGTSGTATDDFSLDSIRLYVNGTAAPGVKFTFNTEYNGSELILMDAIARFEFSDQVNIWAGRFLPPSDRSNLYGPYYANNWAVYNDGIQDGYPSVAVGRDNGVAYWGQFSLVKVSAGVFDVPSTLGTSSVLGAERIMVDLLDPEPGYYLNGTYYGGKDILAFGVAAQQLKSNNAYSADGLFEKKMPDGGALSIESEYTKYKSLGGYDANYATSDGYYGLVSYLFGAPVGPGKIQLLGKYAKANFADGVTPFYKARPYDQKTSDFEINYVIKDFNARLSLFYVDSKFSAVFPVTKKYVVGLQLQM
jgi:hypothetical protein